MIKNLLKSVREYKKPTFLTAFFIFLEAVIECIIPFITANLLNSLEAGAEISEVLKTGGLLAVMAALSLCCGGIAGVTSAKASAGFVKNLRSDMFDRIQEYSFENIDKFSTSSLVTRMTTDINDVQMTYMMLIRIGLRAPLMMLFSAFMAFYMGGKLAISFLIIIPVLGGGFFIISRFAMPAFRRVFVKYDKMNESIEENVRAMRVVKGFAREEYEKKRFGQASDGICKDFTKADSLVALNTPLMQLCIYFNLIFILYVGSKLIVTHIGIPGGLGIGHLTAMLTYGFQIMMQLMMMSILYVFLTMTMEAMRRINEVLTEKPAIISPANAVKEVKDGSVSFRGVRFKYSKTAERYSLEKIDLAIRSGMTVGILGGTGSGKSSLVQLIPRLYDATEGEVLVGGINVKEYDLTSLRSSVAMVLQKNLLFSGTIRENLLWGNPDATEEEMVAACRLAQADDFVRSFPDGYETHIEQGGTNVSGGQKQRLCIARALLKKPKILILDDSTSAVDTRTDALIRRGFAEFIPETTKIIIAQRVASVQDADLIIVMDGGKIESMGKHEELLASSHIYREVYEQQVNGKGDEENE